MVRGLSKLSHYYQKLRTVGISRCARAVHYRLQRALFIEQMRRKGGRDLGRVSAVISVDSHPLHYLNEIAKKCDQEQVVVRADQYVVGQFDLLGSEKQVFEKMPWHCDIRLSAQDPYAPNLFDADQFYADISIKEGRGDKIYKDIKVPWELSRFHHLPVLALAYAMMGDKKYARAAQEQLTDWLDANPYLCGVNWVCPMEVAIRATNWIVAWHWLREVWQQDVSWCSRFASSLRDHMRYLEGNWEFYDGRTSNHYLSNLVGYLYLCWFFQGEPGTRRKRDWCYRELVRELDWQIFDEGTSYEGSTRYHQLVTELMIHAALLAREMGIAIDTTVLQKIDSMLAFIDWCTPIKAHEVVAIGDDDSGVLLHKDFFGLSAMASLLCANRGSFFGVKRYAQFGISISKADDWHVILRHHSYNCRQPSGHFHDDVGSVTIAYYGIPIVVDPGTYVYTASRMWRDKFRSPMMHNVCYLPGYPLDQKEIFALDMDEGRCENLCHQGGVLRARHQLAPDVSCEREVVIDEEACAITDRVSAHDMLAMKNFIFSPEIGVQQDGDSWLLMYQQKPILRFIAPLQARVTQEETWMAPSYGWKVRTTCLKVSHVDGEPVIFQMGF